MLNKDVCRECYAERSWEWGTNEESLFRNGVVGCPFVSVDVVVNGIPCISRKYPIEESPPLGCPHRGDHIEEEELAKSNRM